MRDGTTIDPSVYKVLAQCRGARRSAKAATARVGQKSGETRKNAETGTKEPRRYGQQQADLVKARQERRIAEGTATAKGRKARIKELLSIRQERKAARTATAQPVVAPSVAKPKPAAKPKPEPKPVFQGPRLPAIGRDRWDANRSARSGAAANERSAAARGLVRLRAAGDSGRRFARDLQNRVRAEGRGPTNSGLGYRNALASTGVEARAALTRSRSAETARPAAARGKLAAIGYQDNEAVRNDRMRFYREEVKAAQRRGNQAAENRRRNAARRAAQAAAPAPPPAAARPAPPPPPVATRSTAQSRARALSSAASRMASQNNRQLSRSDTTPPPGGYAARLRPPDRYQNSPTPPVPAGPRPQSADRDMARTSTPGMARSRVEELRRINNVAPAVDNATLATFRQSMGTPGKYAGATRHTAEERKRIVEKAETEIGVDLKGATVDEKFDHLAAISGIPQEYADRMTINAVYGNMIVFEGGGANRVLKNENGVPVLKNSSYFPGAKQRGNGQAIDMYARSAIAARAAGVERIHVHGAGSGNRTDGSNPGMTGYTTWQNYGYDGRIPAGNARDRIRALDPSLRNAEYFSESAFHPDPAIRKEARAIWTMMGADIYVDLNLKNPRSVSWKNFEANFAKSMRSTGLTLDRLTLTTVVTRNGGYE